MFLGGGGVIPDIIPAHSVPGLMLRGSWSTQNELYVCLCFGLVWFGCFLRFLRRNLVDWELEWDLKTVRDGKRI